MIKYLPSHEYVRVDGNYGYIGISPYAAKQLGNIVYVDMPEVDDEVEAGEDFGAIESVKAASDLFAPVSGTVVEVNEKLADNPGLVGQDPMENWIIKVEMSDPGDLDKLLTPEQYEELCANENH
ncbi:MAG: glycine cleavage system protein GcvH [Muribaculaceae bacterium]